MPLERRNEPQMLRQFHKMYPSYNINPLLRRRHQDLVEAQSFFALHTHRSGRTASDSRSRLFPATQLVATRPKVSINGSPIAACARRARATPTSSAG